MRRLSLKANFSWVVVGRTLYAGLQWGMLMALTKLTDPETVGLYVLGLAVTAPIIMAANLKLRVVLATDAREEYAFGHYLALRLLTVAAALLIIVGIAWLGRFSPAEALAIIAVGIAKSVEAVSDAFWGLFQQAERMDYVARSQIIKGGLSIIALSGLVYLTHNLLIGLAGLILSWLITLAAYDLPMGRRIVRDPGGPGSGSWTLRPLFRIAALKRLFWLAAPLGVITLIRSLNVNIPRYFIEDHLGLYELGIFGGLAYIVAAEGRLNQALGQAASPRLAQYSASGDLGSFARLLFKLILIAGGAGLAGWLATVVAGKQILTLLYNAEYARYAHLFPWFALAAALSQVIGILGDSMTANRTLMIQVPMEVLNLAAITLACMLLIPSRGLAGAAAAVLIANVLGVLVSTGVVLYTLRSLWSTGKVIADSQ